MANLTYSFTFSLKGYPKGKPGIGVGFKGKTNRTPYPIEKLKPFDVKHGDKKKELTLYMTRIKPCNENDYQTLVEIWERSVRSTHEFLTEKDIMEIRESLISKYFKEVSLYMIFDEETIAGFIGLYDHNIEMLFVDSNSMGKGLGSKLLDFAKSLGADSVDVNEQNPRALGFYQAHGFRVVCRDEYDNDGRPFPILHLKL